MKLFMSYAHNDRDVAGKLASKLAQAGYEVWSPDQYLFPGDNWPLKIGEALQQSDGMIVLLSPDAVKSDWVRHEIEFAIGSTRYQDRLIPVLVRPTEDIPWILRKLKYVRLGKSLADAAKRIVDQLQHSPTAATA